jgi:hypothetical protein
VLKIRNLSLEESRTKKEERDEQMKKINSVEDVLNNNYGTGRDINLLFIGLARAAGFDSTEVWVGTRNDHIFMLESHDARELNAELVWVSAGGKEYYLDPAAHYFGFGVLPWYETRDTGLKLTKQGGVPITSPIGGSTDATIERSADLNMSDTGEITGTIRIDFDRQEGASRRESYRDEDEIGRQKKLEDEIKSWLPANAALENVTVSNWDNVEEPLRIEAKLKIEGFTALAVRRVLLPAEIFRDPQLRSFEAAHRVNAIYFHYPYQEIDDVKVHVPDSFKISLPSVPKIDKGAAVYELAFSSQGNATEVKRRLVIDGIIFPKDVYPTLRAFFNAVKTNDDAQIMLQNAQSAQN